MKILKIYMDTSVLGALFDSDDPSRVQITSQLLDEMAERKKVGV